MEWWIAVAIILAVVLLDSLIDAIRDRKVTILRRGTTDDYATQMSEVIYLRRMGIVDDTTATKMLEVIASAARTSAKENA